MTLRPASLEQLAAHADRIVRAECVATCEKTDSARRRAYAYTTFHVLERIAGSDSGETIVIRSIALGETVARTMGLPIFRPGAEVVLFLSRPNDDGYPYIVGIGMGCYTISNGVASQYIPVPKPSVSRATALGAEHYIERSGVSELENLIRASAR